MLSFNLQTCRIINKIIMKLKSIKTSLLRINMQLYTIKTLVLRMYRSDEMKPNLIQKTVTTNHLNWITQKVKNQNKHTQQKNFELSDNTRFFCHFWFFSAGSCDGGLLLIGHGDGTLARSYLLSGTIDSLLMLSADCIGLKILPTCLVIFSFYTHLV